MSKERLLKTFVENNQLCPVWFDTISRKARNHSPRTGRLISIFKIKSEKSLSSVRGECRAF